MNILHITYEFSGHSGAAKQAKTLVSELLRLDKGVGCEIVSVGSVSDIRVLDGIKCYFVKKDFFSCVKFFVLFASKFDVIHLHGFFFLYLIFGFLWRKKIILKTTLFGEDDFTSIRKRSYGWMKGVACGLVDVNIALTNQIRENNIKYLDSSKIKVIPNGVAVNNFLLSRKENIFCVVGLICERKNTLEAIKFFKKNYSQIEGSLLYVVGPGPGFEHLIEYSEEYYNMCFDESLNCDKIIFTGNLDKENLNYIYERALAIILFSKNEGMPNVILEAMSYNCVPITTDIGGVYSDVYKNGVSGILIEDFDRAPRISDVISMSVSGEVKKRCVNEFSISSIANKYISIYKVVNEK